MRDIITNSVLIIATMSWYLSFGDTYTDVLILELISRHRCELFITVFTCPWNRPKFSRPTRKNVSHFRLLGKVDETKKKKKKIEKKRYSCLSYWIILCAGVTGEQNKEVGRTVSYSRLRSLKARDPFRLLHSTWFWTVAVCWGKTH